MCKAKPKTLCHPKQGIKLLNFNIEGLASGLEDPEFLDMMYKHDICVFCETWRKDDSKINLPGWWDFSIVRPKTKKSGRFSGVISFFCKEGLRSGIKVVEVSEGFVWVRLDAKVFNLKNNLFLCAAYIPPQYSKNTESKKVDYFQTLNDSILKYGSQGNIMIAGDLNARIGVDHTNSMHKTSVVDGILPEELMSSRVTKPRMSCDDKINAYGKKLLELSRSFNLKIANGSVPGDRQGNFTCHHNKGASVVDYIVCDDNVFNLVSRMSVYPPRFKSIHSPISTTLDTTFQIEIPVENVDQSPPKIKWDISKARNFQQMLNQEVVVSDIEGLYHKISESTSNEEVEQCVSELTNILVSNATKCFGISRKIVSKSKKPKSKPWYDRNCISLKKRLSNLAKLLLRRPKDPFVRGKFNTVKREYKNIVKTQKQLYHINSINKLEGLTKQPKQFWQYVKQLGNASKFGRGMGNYINKETWLDHFRKLNRKDPSLLAENSEYCKEINDQVCELIQGGGEINNCELLKRFTAAEVEFGIKMLKRGKSSGSDVISNDIIKSAKDSIGGILVSLFNKLLELKYFPSLWSLGLIVPIHKGGELDDPNNYRGITLNSCLSKLFTYILNMRLSHYCEDNGLMEDNQIGFRRGFRTADHVFTLKTLIDKSFANKKKLYTCFVDFKKAYDTVWRNGLFFKMLKSKINPGFVQLLQNMYSKLRSCVQIQGGISSWFDSLIGLKQGCNLSPILFNLFINSLIHHINSSNPDSPMLDNIQVSCLFYADDLVILSETKEGLKKSLDALNNYINKWVLEVNPKKTKCLTFSRGRAAKTADTFKLGSTVLDNCDSYCYLGVIFCKSGSMNAASKALHDKALGAMFSLLRNINRHNACKFEILVDLFEKMVLPIALYNSEVWGSGMIPVNGNNIDYFNPVSISKHLVEKLHMRFLKIGLVVGQRTSNWAVRGETGRFPMIVCVFRFMIKFLFHLKGSPSNILRAALQTSRQLADAGVHTWYTAIQRIMTFCQLDYLMHTTDTREIHSQLRKLRTKIEHIFVNRWLKHREVISESDTKLGIYLSVKDNFGLASYLKLSKFPQHRMAISKLRLSAHKLPIETGRYEQTPRQVRWCPLGCQQLGDELHYLYQCRHPFMLNLRNNCPITQMGGGTSLEENQVEHLRGLLKSSNASVVGLFGSYASKVLKLFKDLTT